MSEDIFIHPFNTPCGELLLGSIGTHLCLCDWRFRRMRTTIDARVQRLLGGTYREGSSPVIEQAMEQLNAYFIGERTAFDIPVRWAGTALQQRVWQSLQEVPYGTTCTYADLTLRVAVPGAIRAVAAANGANALSIIVPCHRIIGSGGELVGYAGGLDAKRKLLLGEGVPLPPLQTSLFDVEAMVRSL